MNDAVETNLQDASAVIEAFGGIRPMAQKLDVPVSTVQGWKQRDAIPENRAGDILAAATIHNVDLGSIGAALKTAEENASAIDQPAGSDEPDPETPKSNTQASKTPPPPKAPSSSGNSGALIVSILALVVAVGVGAWMYLQADIQGDPAIPSAEIATLSARLQALEGASGSDSGEALRQQFSADIADLRAEITRLVAAQSGSAAPVVKIEGLESRLQATETKFDQGQRKATRDAAAAAAALSAATDEIGQLRQQLVAQGENKSLAGQNTSAAVGIALAAGRLQRAMDRGGPYEEALTSLRALSAGNVETDAILDRLAGRAAAGIPTRDALVRSFPDAVRTAVAAASDETAGSWTDRTLQRVRNTVSIRRIGVDVAGDAPDAHIARAEAKALAGDLAGAVAELNGLAEPAASAVASWRGDAQARLAADEAVGQLEASAIARLQAGNGGT